jgi:hypothetical protein
MFVYFFFFLRHFNFILQAKERRAIEKMAARPDVLTEDDQYYWDGTKMAFFFLLFGFLCFDLATAIYVVVDLIGSSSNELKKELTTLIERCANDDKFEMTML